MTKLANSVAYKKKYDITAADDFYGSDSSNNNAIIRMDFEAVAALINNLNTNTNTNSGTNGKSAYQLALENGFEGTEAEWIESLNGSNGYSPIKGVDYFDGVDGYTPIKGVDYFDGVDGGMTDGNKGDITVSNSGASWTIGNNVVTVDKLEQIATAKLLGRHSSGTGNVQKIDLNSTLQIIGSELARSALTGAITSPAGSNATLLGAFTYAQLDAAISDKRATVSTTNATPTDIKTIATTTGKEYFCEFVVTATTTSKTYSSKISGTFRNLVGIVAKIGTSSKDEKTNFATAGVEFFEIGSDIKVRVTGEAATNIEWTIITINLYEI